MLDKPVVQYVVEELVAAGIQRVLFVTGRRKRAIEDHFDADPELGSGPLIDSVEIFYTRQARPAGLGDALRYGATFGSGNPVVVALGDSIIRNATITDRLIEAYTGDVVAAIGVETVPDEAVKRYGIVIGEERDGVIAVEQVLEKPSPDEVASRFAVAAPLRARPGGVRGAPRDTAGRHRGGPGRRRTQPRDRRRRPRDCAPARGRRAPPRHRHRRELLRGIPRVRARRAPHRPGSTCAASADGLGAGANRAGRQPLRRLRRCGPRGDAPRSSVRERAQPPATRSSTRRACSSTP